MKKFILSIVLNLFVLSVFAQLEKFSLSSNQQFIENAVENGLFIIRQEYKLQDISGPQPVSYGLDGKDFFGETYSLGIRMTDGYYISNKVVAPWDYDTNFDIYCNDPKYAPTISKTSYWGCTDTIWAVFSVDKNAIDTVKENSFYKVESGLFHGKGFQSDITEGKKEGWIVWVVTDEPVTEKMNSPVSLITYRKELTFDPEKNSYGIDNPTFNKEIIGGIYILPVVTDIGQITFRLAGLLHAENEKWVVIQLKGNIPAENSIGEKKLTPLMEEQSQPQGEKKDKMKK